MIDKIVVGTLLGLAFICALVSTYYACRSLMHIKRAYHEPLNWFDRQIEKVVDWQKRHGLDF